MRMLDKENIDDEIRTEMAQATIAAMESYNRNVGGRKDEEI